MIQASLPVLAYHGVGPGERMGPALFEHHLRALGQSGLPSLSPDELDGAGGGFLLTFDDGFADLWTHGQELLEAHGVKATVFAIPSYAGDGPPRPRGSEAHPGGAGSGLAEAARAGGPHPAFLRWSELRALEATGLVTVHSHSHSHRMGWIGEEIIGFHLGGHDKQHWSLPQATGGDERLGIPRYRRGSALAHRLYFDDPGLRDRLAKWLEERGGLGYVQEQGATTVKAELQAQVEAYRRGVPGGGRWESEREREARTLEEIARARELLEDRLGGTRDELCLPWGQYDDVTLECARRAGIRRVYTLDRGANPAGRVGFLVKRFEPRARGPLWLRTRLWIYRSAFRAGLYGRLAGRPARGQA